MTGVSSASPDNLEVFVKNAGAASDTLAGLVSSAAGVVEAFYNTPMDPRFNPRNSGMAFDQAKRLVSIEQQDQDWIRGIRHAFIQADANTLPDANIAASLTAQGINPNPPAQLTADEPVYKGATMYSGWTDDPVNTGGGNFFEPEVDLALPDALMALGWPRSYNSRFVTGGAHGPGWTCWADVRIEPGAEAVVFYGEDGQEAPIGRSSDGRLLPHPALDAVVEETADGFELHWRWTSRHPGQTWSFDTHGALRSLRDRTGAVTTVERDEEGRLTALVHSGGRRLELAWTGDAIIAATCSDGRRVEFGYLDGRLATVRRPGGGRRYTYGPDGLLAEVFDDDGVRVVANDYDAEGRVVAQTSPHGRVARYRYRPATLVVTDEQGGPATLFRHDPVGRLIEMQLADGTRATRRFDPAGRPVEVVGFDGSVTRRRFDDRGRCVEEQRPEGTRRWDYDELDRVRVATDEAGAEWRFEYRGAEPLPRSLSGPLGLRTVFGISDGRITSVTDADGVEVHLEYDAEGELVARRDGEGAVTRYSYHRSGSLTSVESPTGEITEWIYDADDRPVTAVAPDGSRATRTYSAAGRLLEERDPSGAVTTWTWGPHGSLAEMTGPDLARTRYEWDVNGWPNEVHQPDGGIWSYRRDVVGRIESAVGPGDERWRMEWGPEGLASVTDPAGHAFSFELLSGDGTSQLDVCSPAGRRYRVRYGAGGRMEGIDTSEGPSGMDIGYDGAGRPVRWTLDGEDLARASYSAAGRLESLTRPGSGTWRWSYDRAGRSVMVSGPDGDTLFSYDAAGRPARVVGTDGQATVLGWDRAGRLSTVETAGRVERIEHNETGLPCAVTGAGGARWEWAYDAAGRLVRVTDPLGAETALVRDSAGRIVAASGPEGGRWTYDHDASSRLERLTDPLQRTTRYHWDPAGRISRVDLPDGRSRTYRWDADDSLTGIEEVDQSGGRAAILAVERDTDGRSARMTDSGGRPVTLTWDALGRVVRSAGGAGEVTVDWSDPAAPVIRRTGGADRRARLSPAGMPVGLDDPRVGEVILERDGGGRLMAVRAAGLTRRWVRDEMGDTVAYYEEIGGIVRHATLERDGAGRVVVAAEDGVTRTFTYDVAGQLLVEEGPRGRLEWAYDRAGRLTIESGPEGTRRLSYDDAGQLVSVESPAGLIRYDYDGLGRRVAERGPEGETLYLWDGTDRLVGLERRSADGRSERVELDYDALGRLVRAGGTELVWGVAEGPLGLLPERIGGRELVSLPGVPLAEVDGDSVQWLSADWRGCVGTRTVWGARPPAPGGHPEVGFLGEVEVDGLVWLRNRWYDPATHSFLSRDPRAASLATTGATNPYLYANNDPLQWADPLGLRPMTVSEASAQMDTWRRGHWDEVLVTAAAVAAIAFMPMSAPVVLGMALGAAAGAGGTLLSDYVHHTPIDWGQVVMDGALGAAAGGGGTLLSDVTLNLGRVALAGRALGATYGAVSGAGFVGLDRWATGQKFSPLDEAIGAAGGAVGSVLARHLPDEIGWESQTNLSENQIRVYNEGGPAANFYKKIVARATDAADKLNEAAKATNLRRDTIASGVSSFVAGAATPPDHLPPSSTSYPPVTPPAIPALF